MYSFITDIPVLLLTEAALQKNGGHVQKYKMLIKGKV